MPSAITNKQLVRKACKAVIEDEKSRPSDKVKAANILERMCRVSLESKHLARRKREQELEPKPIILQETEPSERLDTLLASTV